MKEIRGDAKTIRQLLGASKYAIDYYQREYKWQTKQVIELLEDLTEKFLESYEEGHERKAVADYGHYFVGSIIISDRDGQKFVIDGQQRLTSITLLLIYLQHRLTDQDQITQVAELIFSQKFGKRSFNLDVPERNDCMDALYSDSPFDGSEQSESVQNIVGRYGDIEDAFPDELLDEVLPYFVDWLIENVHIVEITAYSDEDAYTIFETMNDRGLSLTPTDMLKGYLLANISDPDQRNKASQVWRQRIGALQDIGKEEDADGIKSWLRSQYADTIRERKRGATPKDFGLIGTEFHRWVRDQEDRLGLQTDADFAGFIERDFAFYARWYERLRHASETVTQGLEHVFYNAQHNFTLQYPVLLAPVNIEDDEAEIIRKLRVVGSYIDILVYRRLWNWRAISYSTMQYAMFLVMREIRGKSAVETAELLKARLDQEEETFTSNDRFRLHGTNRRQIRLMLARITDFVEAESGLPSHFSDYLAPGKNSYEVEHIWADHAERHTDEFEHPADFQAYRGRIGGLLLLPKSFNASFGDLPYKEKYPHYFGQNLLAQSLHEKAYQRNPGFAGLLERSGLPFKSHTEFKRADLDARQELYGQLAEAIWDPKRLEQEASA